MKLTLIGDSHACFRQLHEIIKRHQFHNDIIHVGDVGIGFGEKRQNFPDNFFFIAGNHECPEKCQELYPINYIGRFKFYKPWNMFFVSGAWSIDKACRVEGRDWWPNEELSASEMNAALDLYAKTKPKYVITHDGPTCAIKTLVNPFFNEGGIIPTNTVKLLDAMLEIHRPEIWVFGHHHKSFDQIINGTRFVCLDILEDRTLDFYP